MPDEQAVPASARPAPARRRRCTRRSTERFRRAPAAKAVCMAAARRDQRGQGGEVPFAVEHRRHLAGLHPEDICGVLDQPPLRPALTERQERAAGESVGTRQYLAQLLAPPRVATRERELAAQRAPAPACGAEHAALLGTAVGRRRSAVGGRRFAGRAHRRLQERKRDARVLVPARLRKLLVGLRHVAVPRYERGELGPQRSGQLLRVIGRQHLVAQPAVAGGELRQRPAPAAPVASSSRPASSSPSLGGGSSPRSRPSAARRLVLRLL